ncbi:hypothetical protein BDU57DRAFT_530622 [Ampelomyces quisqualis]|uniref:Uncharacterized protein n=1 Tax=Ampelomyces quisqualis TaxID=50730 RepID=A0A6A5QLZ0_AMPQU|nr:hypothetical protein BDU57DRAFT_530622 [Ampelomyces quisqualis]
MAPQPGDIWETYMNLPKVPRRNLLLLYIWKLIPATTDAIHSPDEGTKVWLYEFLIDECKSSKEAINTALFESTYQRHGYPWAAGNTIDKDGGKDWVTILARTAIKLRMNVKNAENKSLGDIRKEVAKTVEKRVYQDWLPEYDRIFDLALRFVEAELNEEARAEANAPARLQ